MNRYSREFLFYILAAVLSALSDLTVFTVLVHLGLYFFYAQAISRIIGGVTSFIVNKKLSFNTPWFRTVVESRRFLVLYIVSYTLAFLWLWLYHERLAFPLLYAKVMSDGTGFILNFLVMRSYVYKEVPGLIAISRTFLKGKDIR